MDLTTDHNSRNPASFADGANFSLWDVVTLGTVELRDLWHIWMAILAWTVLSYICVHVIAFLIGILSLRHHSWMPIIVIPIAVTALAGPFTLGALSSFFLALIFSTANRTLGAGHCMMLGVSQTTLAICTSFLRILATL
ncbi:hypothetical protein GPALN_011298 [Globodera pallida]|nr:hypothetical protein GPALN_011298 [Globodera pallida]